MKIPATAAVVKQPLANCQTNQIPRLKQKYYEVQEGFVDVSDQRGRGGFAECIFISSGTHLRIGNHTRYEFFQLRLLYDRVF